ncbi:flagellar motor switch protein [Pseudooceanicola aestuarii]|uniref:flagellar motor switch protein n=1 Tax=Pseudooceanicola aestuarii TaxID=2697319 RepID=UPI0013D5A28B|nr:flagellar motor switch protein [Pseudooceanicola aestuarii]
MSLLLDLAIIVLLIGTLIYALIVERKVRTLMRTLRELEPMIGDFSAAVDRSESSVSMLKSLGQSLPGGLGGRGRTAPAEGTAAGAAEGRDSGQFRSMRDTSGRAAKVNTVPMKSELVRGFFETVRSREA